MSAGRLTGRWLADVLIQQWTWLFDEQMHIQYHYTRSSLKRNVWNWAINRDLKIVVVSWCPEEERCQQRLHSAEWPFTNTSHNSSTLSEFILPSHDDSTTSYSQLTCDERWGLQFPSGSHGDQNTVTLTLKFNFGQLDHNMFIEKMQNPDCSSNTRMWPSSRTTTPTIISQQTP